MHHGDTQKTEKLELDGPLSKLQLLCHLLHESFCIVSPPSELCQKIEKHCKPILVPSCSNNQDCHKYGSLYCDSNGYCST